MKRNEQGLLASFVEPIEAAEAIRALRAAGFAEVRAAMPAPFPEVLKALERRSLLGWFALLGALLGVTAGFALAIWTSLDWPLVTGGKPIVSIPPFVVIAFEISVLIGAILTLSAVLLLAVHARRIGSVPDPGHRFSNNRIGIFVVGGDRKAAEKILNRKGAEEVRFVD